MHCLVLSDIFPNGVETWRGPYNRRQIECLARHCSVTVLNPLPWTLLLDGVRYWTLVTRPDNVLEGIIIHHPVFWHIPVLGRSLTWRSVLAAARRALRKTARGNFNIVLATFAYPHGLVAKHISRKLGVPYAIKVRGSDLHSLPSDGWRRDRTAEALQGAAAVIAVSSNLAAIAFELGSRPDRIHVLPNGVDADSFHIIPRVSARKRLGIQENGKIVLFVGDLVPVKGVDVLLRALHSRGKTSDGDERLTLAGAGTGSLKRWMEKRVAHDGLSACVRFLGHLGRHEVALWMNAADALVLPSQNEGCPNVVLEALCCGTPVVASRVGAVAALLDKNCGIQVEPGNAADLFRAIHRALHKDWNRPAIRRRVEGTSWEANGAKLHEILADAVKA